MAAADSRVSEDGSIVIRTNLVIPSEEIELRVTTSGGPGGQHANRSLTKVVASFRVAASEVLTNGDRDLLHEKIGTVVRSSSSRYRSQGQNRTAALEHLADKIATALVRQPVRRATRPTKGSKVRRVDDKKARGRTKVQRRAPLDD